MVTNNDNSALDIDDGRILEQPLLISVDQLAMILGISTRSVWRLLSAQKIVEPVRIGGAVRWRFAEIKNWIDRGCPPTNGGRK